MCPTLVLTRGDLQRCVDPPALITLLQHAMTVHRSGDAYRLGAAASPTVTAMVLLPGTAPGIPAYTVKVNAKNPRRRPALNGVICLHDADSGDLLAILDSGWITALRTGIAAAIGTHVLARDDARSVGVIGAGVQGRAQLRALAALRRLVHVHVHDTDRDAASAFLEEMTAELGVPGTLHGSARELAAVSDIILLATWSRRPLLDASDIKDGSHLTSLGADEPGKVELGAELLGRSLVVTDDQSLAEPVLGRTDAGLGAVLRGDHPGRTERHQTTVYSPVGLPMQDCVSAWHAFHNARAAGLGTYVTFEE